MYDFPEPRLLFKPDPAHTLVDIDLAGADARVAAWDCDELGDPSYRLSFLRADQTGEKIHKVNAEKIFLVPDGKREPFYTNAKKGVHATTYGAKPNTLVSRAGFTLPQATNFQRQLFTQYPGIRKRILHIELLLQQGKPIQNKFGFETRYYDRPDAALTEALAWGPQSTVAIVTYKAMRIIRKYFWRHITLLLQVHDSLVMQIPTYILDRVLRELHGPLHEIVIPFPTPLVIPWGLKTSTQSWGQCKDRPWH
jgi:DNA polymerase I-like protein with 3'-5' exonuclease and polymerase domains